MTLYLPSGSRVVPIRNGWLPGKEVTLTRDIILPKINYLNNDITSGGVLSEFKASTSWYQFPNIIDGYLGFIYRIDDVVHAT
jgi:hypothetical protein